MINFACFSISSRNWSHLERKSIWFFHQFWMFLNFVAKTKSFGKEKNMVLKINLDVFEFRCENEVIWKGKAFGFVINFGCFSISSRNWVFKFLFHDIYFRIQIYLFVRIGNKRAVRRQQHFWRVSFFIVCFPGMDYYPWKSSRSKVRKVWMVRLV